MSPQKTSIYIVRTYNMGTMEFVEILKYYLTHNFALLVMAVGFFILYLNKNSRLKDHSRLLLIDVGLLVVLSIFTSIEYCFESLTVTYPILYVATIVGYSMRPLLLYMVVLTFNRPRFRDEVLLMVPLVLNFFFVVTSPATHWIFYYGDNNVFVRNIPWGFLPHVTSLFYLVYLAFLMVKLFREDDKVSAVAAIVILTANGVSTMLETFDIAEDILNTTAMASILFYFVFMFTFFKKRDSLTGLLDRHTFYNDFGTYRNRITALVGFDLNGLKRINDTEGHASGDTALRTISRIFLAASNKNLKFYRLGGDEFEAICIDMKEPEIAEKLEQVSETIKGSGYVCSYGYAMKEKGDTVDEILHRADEAMYCSKRGYYLSHDRRD